MKFTVFIPALILVISCGKDSKHKEVLTHSSSDSQSQENQSIEDTGSEVSSSKPEESSEVESESQAKLPEAIAIDASSAENPVYLSFQDGTLASVNSDELWAISIKRTMFQSNSGTSGDAGFGVYNTGSDDFAEITECLYEDLSFDEELPIPGPPGSGSFQGNPILNDWYSYDMVTHAVSSKKEVYLITDGLKCFKFQILSYQAGVYEVLAEGLQ